MANLDSNNYKDVVDNLYKKDSNKKFGKVENYDTLLAKAQAKKADLKRAEAYITDEASLDDYVSIKPSNELALIDYYSSMPEVEIEPEIAEFWKAQQNGLKELNIEGPKNEYMAAYSQWQELVDQMDGTKRDELGIDNIDYQEKEARKDLKNALDREKDAKERASEARKNIKRTMFETNPFALMIGKITGNDKELRAIKDAKKGSKDARKGVKEAKRGVEHAELRIAQIKERRKVLQERKDKLSVKEYMAIEKMNDALEKMAVNQRKAAAINENSKAFAETLHKQYEEIDKFKTMQKLKQSALNDPSTRAILQADNPELFQTLENIPDTLPENAFKVTLHGPIQFLNNSQKVTDIESKIDEIKQKLPDETEVEEVNSQLDEYKTKIETSKNEENNLQSQIQKCEDESKNLNNEKNKVDSKLQDCKLKPTDTKDSVQQELNDPDLDKSSEKAKNLQMKLNHLISLEKIADVEKALKDSRTKLENTTDVKEQEQLNKIIKTQQNTLANLKKALNNDEYSRNIIDLENKSKKLDNEHQNKLSNLIKLNQVQKIQQQKLEQLQQKLKNLEQQKNKFEQQQDSITNLEQQKNDLEKQQANIEDLMQNLDENSAEIEASDLCTGIHRENGSTYTLSSLYNCISQGVEKIKQKTLISLEKNHIRLPLEQNQDNLIQDDLVEENLVEEETTR